MHSADRLRNVLTFAPLQAASLCRGLIFLLAISAHVACSLSSPVSDSSAERGRLYLCGRELADSLVLLCGPAGINKRFHTGKYALITYMVWCELGLDIR